MSQMLSRRFKRPLIALGLVAGLAFSPLSTAPAKAGNDEMAAFLTALTAMIIIGSVLDDDHRYGSGYTQYGYWNSPMALPESCLKTFRTRDGYEAYFSKRCLRNSYSNWRSLPERCEVSLKIRDEWGDGRRITVYKPRCLRRAGFFIARTAEPPLERYGFR
jgi:hypothetical protein